MIRKSTREDLPVITDIYNQAIKSRYSTADTELFAVDERMAWYNKQSSNPKTPVFVYEIENRVVAYGLISLYRFGRPAFKDVGEVSYYVDFKHHRKGIGNLLLKHLISEAKTMNYTHLIAMLLDCNLGSILLLEKQGFCCWGKMPNIANIDDACYSHLYYGLSLRTLE